MFMYTSVNFLVCKDLHLCIISRVSNQNGISSQ